MEPSVITKVSNKTPRFLFETSHPLTNPPGNLDSGRDFYSKQAISRPPERIGRDFHVLGRLAWLGSASHRGFPLPGLARVGQSSRNLNFGRGAFYSKQAIPSLPE